MKIDSFIRAPTTELRQLVQSLKIGAELRAIVRLGEAGIPLLELDNGELLIPRSNVPLRPGEQLQLRVAQSQPTVVLQIVGRTSSEPPLSAALRTVLPQPGAREPLSANVAQLLAAGERTALPEPVRSALLELGSRLRSPAELGNPARLPVVLRESGLALEARLSLRPPEPPTNDVKAQLLRVTARIRAALANSSPANDSADQQMLTKLLDGGERMLARLETLQMQAAHSRGLDVLFELPIRFGEHVDNLQLRIQDERRQQEHSDGSPSGMNVRLRFEFAGMGAVGAALRLSGDDISLHWWAEQASTAATLQSALPMLTERLEQLGLTVTSQSAVAAAPPPVDELPVLRLGGLVREKA